MPVIIAEIENFGRPPHRRMCGTRQTSITPQTNLRGIAHAALVGIAFAANSTLAGVAYAGGSNALSVLVVRAALACMVLFLVLGRHAVPRRLPARRRYAAIGLGLLFASYSYGVMASIQRLPVALVIVTFYTYPMMVAIVAWCRGREPFRTRTAAALLVAFVGIGLALDIVGAKPDLIGVGLTLASAMILTLVLTLNEAVRGAGDSRPVTLHMLATATSAFLVALLLSGNFALPHTPYGWVGFIGAPLFYTGAIISLFIVLARIGPVRASLVMNVEPVSSVLFGYLLLDQRLHPLQLAGVGLVIFAIVLVEGTRLRE